MTAVVDTYANGLTPLVIVGAWALAGAIAATWSYVVRAHRRRKSVKRRDSKLAQQLRRQQALKDLGAKPAGYHDHPAVRRR